MTSASAFRRIFDLAKIGDDAASVILKPSIAECAAIAEWLGVSAVETLEAEVTLSRNPDDCYRYEARFAADVVQACVVTLEPVRSRLEGEIQRLYRFSADQRPGEVQRPGGGISLLDKEEPEQVETALIDIAAPVLEELSLALDPYPRAPGVVFEVPVEPASDGDNPFAVLEPLKAKLRTGEGQAPAQSDGRGKNGGTARESKHRK